MTNELADGKDRADEAHEHSRRRGCSCFTIAIYGFFLLVALAVLGVLYLERKLIQNGLDQLKPTEVADYERWVDAPLNLPPDALVVKPELPAPLRKERETVFREARLQYERWSPVLQKEKPSLLDIMSNGRPLNGEQLDKVISVTSSFPPLLARAKALFTNPDYVANPRTYPTVHFPYLDMSMMQRALNVFAIQQVTTGDFTGAVDTVDVLLRMNRHDPYAGFIYTVTGYSSGNQAAQIAALVERATSDTAHLQALLDVMNRQRDLLYGINDVNVYMGDSLPVIAQMNADGYTSLTAVTPRQVQNYAIYGEEDYLKWLDKHLPSGSPRRVDVASRLAEYRSRPKGKLNFDDALNRSPLKFALRRIQQASLEFFLVSSWQSNSRFHRNWASSMLNYDTARLSLAQRIAELEGEPVPVKPEDFVPRYMPEFPRDAITGDPIPVPTPGVWDAAADSGTTSTAVAGSE